MLSFKGAAHPRTPDGLARAAQLIGCEAAALEAVIYVEAGVSGFDAEGRPKALFEPHIFFRELASLADKSKLTKAVAAGLAYKRWGEKPYPHDSYPRIESACEIDDDAALRATSWGAPQILGANYKAVGYATIEDMVVTFVESEDEQLRALAQFIRRNGLTTAVNRNDWAAFARGYNGPSWRKNDYANRLAVAYAHAKDGASPAPEPLDTATRNRAVAKAAGVSATAHRATAGMIVVAAPGTMIVAHAVYAFPWWALLAGVVGSVIAALVIWTTALGHKKRAAWAHAASVAPSLSPTPAAVSSSQK